MIHQRSSVFCPNRKKERWHAPSPGCSLLPSPFLLGNLLKQTATVKHIPTETVSTNEMKKQKQEKNKDKKHSPWDTGNKGKINVEYLDTDQGCLLLVKSYLFEELSWESSTPTLSKYWAPIRLKLVSLTPQKWALSSTAVFCGWKVAR